jgi:hypothetical protein
MKRCVMAGSFIPLNQLVITVSMVKCLLKLRDVWPFTIRNDQGLWKVKKSWEILAKVITIIPFSWHKKFRAIPK